MPAWEVDLIVTGLREEAKQARAAEARARREQQRG
jgi:hypothetical protein